VNSAAQWLDHSSSHWLKPKELRIAHQKCTDKD
jgi:hypothetical protein